MRELSKTGKRLPEIQRYANTAKHFPDEWDRFIRNRFRYRFETEELVRSVDRMLNEYQSRGRFEGDCDDISILNAAVLSAAGYPVRFVAIRLEENPEFSHVYVEAFTGFDWQVFDPVVPQGTLYRNVQETMTEDVL